jgi:hypothetical protein
MDCEEKVDFAGGQVHALIGVCVAVIISQSETGLMRTQSMLEAAEQASLARAEGDPVSDDYIAGIRDVMDRLKASVENALERRRRPPPSIP